MQDQRRIRSAFRNPARIICPRCKLVDSIMQQKGGKPAPRWKSPNRRCGILPEESIGSFSSHWWISCAFGLIQKHQKIKHGDRAGCEPAKTKSKSSLRTAQPPCEKCRKRNGGQKIGRLSRRKTPDRSCANRCVISAAPGSPSSRPRSRVSPTGRTYSSYSSQRPAG